MVERDSEGFKISTVVDLEEDSSGSRTGVIPLRSSKTWAEDVRERPMSSLVIR